MNTDTYQQQVKRSLSGDYYLIASKLMVTPDFDDDGFTAKSWDVPVPSSKKIDILHAIIGCVTESAELMDAWKKNMFYDKPLDEVNLKEEAGDLLWYVALLCNSLGVKLSDVMACNIEKLKRRYPDKFTNEKALTRDIPNEMKVFNQDLASEVDKDSLH